MHRFNHSSFMSPAVSQICIRIRFPSISKILSLKIPLRATGEWDKMRWDKMRWDEKRDFEINTNCCKQLFIKCVMSVSVKCKIWTPNLQYLNQSLVSRNTNMINTQSRLHNIQWIEIEEGESPQQQWSLADVWISNNQYLSISRSRSLFDWFTHTHTHTHAPWRHNHNLVFCFDDFDQVCWVVALNPMGNLRMWNMLRWFDLRLNGILNEIELDYWNEWNWMELNWVELNWRNENWQGGKIDYCLLWCLFMLWTCTMTACVLCLVCSLFAVFFVCCVLYWLVCCLLIVVCCLLFVVCCCLSLINQKSIITHKS